MVTKLLMFCMLLVGILISAASDAGVLPVSTAVLFCVDVTCMMLVFLAAYAAGS